MITPKPFVFVIDDDATIRKSLNRLLRSAGYDCETLSSAVEFLTRQPWLGPSCVIVDVRMPGLNGLDFQESLIQRRRDEQLIFITGHGNIPMCAQAMKAGAVDFLTKPFKPTHLLKCVERALDRSSEQRIATSKRSQARHLLDSLTPREFEVMRLIITGMLNKQIGAELGIAEKTVKVHRGRVMQKLGVTSVAELVVLAQEGGIASSPSPTLNNAKVTQFS